MRTQLDRIEEAASLCTIKKSALHRWESEVPQWRIVRELNQRMAAIKRHQIARLVRYLKCAVAKLEQA